MHTRERAEGASAARAPATSVRAAVPAAPTRMPFEAPTLPLQAAARWSSAASPAQQLQLRARDPLAAAGLSAGGRLQPLPDERAANAPPARGEPTILQMACATDCGCARCDGEKQADLLQTLGIQREARAGAGPPAVDGVAVRARLGAGAPLPDAVADRFSDAYGRDLSHVRVHAGNGLADQLGARAFTVGHDVAFAAGEYNPGTPAGDRLIGHELAHVVQQAGGAGTVQGAGLSADGYEREADGAADAAIAGRRFERFSAVGQAAVQQQEKGAWESVKDVGARAVGAVVDTAREGVLAAIRLVAPGLADFLDDPLGYLEGRLLPALQAWVEGLFGVDLGELAGEAQGAFAELTGTLSGVIAGDAQACLAFASAVQKVRDLYDRLKSNAAIKKIAAALSALNGAFDRVSKLVLAPAFEALRTVAGGVWSVVGTIAETVGGWIDVVKQKVSGAIDWISRKLGFGDGPGLLAFLRKKAQEIWDKLQKTLEPVATPLKVIVGLLLLTYPGTWMYLVFKYGPDVIAAAKWVWAHRSDPDIVTSARDEKRATLAQILATVQNVGAALGDAAHKAGSALQSAVTAALEFAGAVTGLPILGALKGVAASVARGLTSLAATIGDALARAGAWVSRLAVTVAATIRPIQGILMKLGVAVVNPAAIPGMLAGWAWLNLPDCYKPPIIDLLLDALLAILESSPDNPTFGPLWTILKPGVLGFVRQLRKMSAAIKIAAVDKIATFMSAGSPAFLLGFAKGLLSGIWDNTAGLVGDIIELGHLLVGLVEGVVASAASAIMGTSTPPAAAHAAPGATHAPSGATHAGPATAPASAESAAPWLPRLDRAGITEQEITREQLDAYRPATEPAGKPGAPPPVTHEQFNEELGKLQKDLKPSASTVARDAGAALKQYFKGGDASYDQLAQKLGDAWGAAQNLISAQGAKMAREATAVLLGKDGDVVVGEKVGWIAGMVVVEVVVAIFTGGGGNAAKQAANAARAAKAVSKPAAWTTRAFEAIVSAFRKAAEFLKQLPARLRKLAADAKGALQRVLDALRDAGKAIAAFVERLLGRSGKAHVPHKPPTPEAGAAAARTESKAASAESKAAKVEEPPGARPHEEPGATPRPEEPHGEAAGTRAEREASVKESGKVESAELSQRQIDNELQQLADNPHLIEGTAPNRRAKIGEHTWEESPGGWCRRSEGALCISDRAVPAKLSPGGPRELTGPEVKHIIVGDFTAPSHKTMRLADGTEVAIPIESPGAGLKFEGGGHGFDNIAELRRNGYREITEAEYAARQAKEARFFAAEREYQTTREAYNKWEAAGKSGPAPRRSPRPKQSAHFDPGYVLLRDEKVFYKNPNGPTGSMLGGIPTSGANRIHFDGHTWFPPDWSETEVRAAARYLESHPTLGKPNNPHTMTTYTAYFSARDGKLWVAGPEVADPIKEGYLRVSLLVPVDPAANRTLFPQMNQVFVP